MRWRAVGLFAGSALAGGLMILGNPGGRNLSEASPATAPERPISWEAAQSAAGKFRRIRESARQDRSFGSVRVSEEEANSYLHYEMAPYIPPGVSKIFLKFRPGRPQGSAEVDFDQSKEAFGSPSNPLVNYLLRGVHTLGVGGTLSSSGGIARFHLETVTLDGMTLPRVVVDFLVERYLKAHYPAAAINRPFRLPFSIDQVNVQEGSVVLVGRSREPF